MHHLIRFHYILNLNPLNCSKVKWLKSHTFLRAMWIQGHMCPNRKASNSLKRERKIQTFANF